MTPAALKAASDGNIGNLIAAMVPGGIEAQEKRGQLDQATKETLPKDLGFTERFFEALGFVLGEPVDSLFREAIFPAGWRKVPTDHSMWSNIVDADGVKRGSIFFKAAFYDMSAFASLEPRFRVGRDYSLPKESPVTYKVFDACGLVENSITGLPELDYSAPREEMLVIREQHDEAQKKLAAWLDDNFPDWKNPTTHWPTKSVEPAATGS